MEAGQYLNCYYNSVSLHEPFEAATERNLWLGLCTKLFMTLFSIKTPFSAKWSWSEFTPVDTFPATVMARKYGDTNTVVSQPHHH